MKQAKTSFLHEFDQRKWDSDVATFQRSLDLAGKVSSPRVKEMLNQRAAEICARYPRHLKMPDRDATDTGEK